MVRMQYSVTTQMSLLLKTILQPDTMTTVQPTNMFNLTDTNSTTSGHFYESTSNLNDNDTIGSTLAKGKDHLNTYLCDEVSDTKTEQEVWFDFLLPLVCAVGIVGNIFTIVVLSQKTMRTSTNMHLIALASADLMFLVVLGTILFSRHSAIGTHDIYVIYVHAYGPIFLHIALLVSIWLTVALAIERYIAICHPLQAPNMCTINRARYIIVSIYILAILCRAPNFWEYEVLSYFENCSNKTIFVLDYTDLSWNQVYLTVNAILVDSIISAIIPFLSLFLLNIRLIYEVRKSSRYLAYSLSPGSTARYVISKEEVQITVMLISIIISFFICEAPLVVYGAIASINRFEPEISFVDDYDIMRNICNLLLAVKCALNFILYCWFSEKFWQTFKMMFCMRYCIRKFQARKMSHNGSLNGTSAFSHFKRSSKDTGTRETTAV